MHVPHFQVHVTLNELNAVDEEVLCIRASGISALVVPVMPIRPNDGGCAWLSPKAKSFLCQSPHQVENGGGEC